LPDHRHRGGRPPRRSRGGGGPFFHPRRRSRAATAVQFGGHVWQEPADARADAAGRVSAGQPAAVDHVTETGTAGSVRRQRRGRPGGRPRPVPHGSRPEARPGRQHGLVLHQQTHARWKTGRGGARVAHPAAARSQLRTAG